MSGKTPDMEAYRKLLEKLLAEGTGVGRSKDIAALPAGDGKHFVITSDIKLAADFKKGGGKPPQLHGNDVRKRTIAQVEAGYIPADPSDPDNIVWKPNPAAHRIAIKIEENIVIPSRQEEAYEVETGDMLLLQQKHVRRLAEALDKIRSGQLTPEDALLEREPSTGQLVAIFNVYNLDPSTFGFFPDSHVPVELSAETKAISARFAAAAKPKPQPKPRFLPVLPETASFVKKNRTPSETF